MSPPARLSLAPVPEGHMLQTTLEICIDSVAGAVAAEAGGASRVELCANLQEGGTTPSFGMIKAVRAATPSLPVMVMIRPRGGDFCYSPSEVQVMLEDIGACQQLQVAGVVVGALTPAGEVDVPVTRTLLAAARAAGLDVTFHRAADMTRSLPESLEVLIDLGVPRVLTSGGQATAIQGLPMLRRLLDQAAGRIRIMAGCGVTGGNVQQLLAAGVTELHSSAKGHHHSPVTHRPSGMSMCSSQAPQDWRWQVTDAAAVAGLRAAVAASTVDVDGHEA